MRLQQAEFAKFVGFVAIIVLVEYKTLRALALVVN